MVSTKARIKPLKGYLTTLVAERISNFSRKPGKWNDTITGMSVVIMTRPKNIPFNCDEVIGGIKDAKGSCLSSHTVASQLRMLASYGVLTKDTVKAGASYYLNIEIPGELLAQ